MGRLPPRTAETQSTSATTNPRIDIDDDPEFKSLDTELDFHDLYYKYANESSEEMRIVAAKCLHEGFLLASPMEDIKRLQMTLCELLEEENREIILALIPNLKTMILKYCNEYVLSLIPDPTPAGDNTPPKSFVL